MYDFTSKKIFTSHYVTAHEGIFPWLKDNPSPWLPDDFLQLSSYPTNQDQFHPSLTHPQITIVEEEDGVSDEVAEGETTEAAGPNHSGTEPHGSRTEEDLLPEPLHSILPVCEEVLIKFPEENELSCTEEPSTNSQQPPAPTRASKRLQGKIPLYKGMKAKWIDQNLSGCFDVLLPQCNGAVIN